MKVTVQKRLRLLVLMLLPVFSGAIYAAPMDDVFTLLDSGGGSQSGRDNTRGYYITALGFSSRASEAKGYEEARIEALRHLNDLVNGVTISGSTAISSESVSESSQSGLTEYSQEAFREVVDVVFKGHLSAAKTLKQGKYDGRYFVAIAITEQDMAQLGRLRSNPASSVSGTTVVIATDPRASVASFSREAKQVEAKGLASMKQGEQRARELALQDAMRNAVQQVQGVMLQGKSGSFNEALSFALSTKTEGYVGGYEIIDEDISRGNYYIIMMATVNAGQLLSDVSFYLDIFAEPRFSVQSSNRAKTDWLVNELERLGFSINDGTDQATHTFYLGQSQRTVNNHNGKKGVETSLVVKLKDNSSGEILFTVMNDPLKSRIYVKPVERAEQVSQISAYKALQKKLGVEVVQALSRYSEQGKLYQIVIRGARRSDVDLFKHVLNNGSAGQVENWKWRREGKEMTLSYRFRGTLSGALDQWLEEVYQTFRENGRPRRPHMIKADNQQVLFEMVQG